MFGEISTARILAYPSTRFKIPINISAYFGKKLATQRFRRHWFDGNRGEIGSEDAFKCRDHGQSLHFQTGYIEIIE